MSENSEKRPTPVVFGLSGTRLTPAERTAFRQAQPFGFILFKRNCETPDQVKALVSELRHVSGVQDLQIFIDEEGGRVSRLPPPNWIKLPPARTFGLMYERDPEWGIEAVRLSARILSHQLADLGVTINCAPVVDLFYEDASTAIGDRAFSPSPSIVAALARAEVEAFLANGIYPVIKHFPGHGRLAQDPHELLPTIEASRAELEGQDFVPFELLKDVPFGMNSHAVFKSLDPKNPASLSRIVNNDVIRGVLGFDGVLISDDLTMKALDGAVNERVSKALDVGNDIVLHCNGDIDEIVSMLPVLQPMNDAAWLRWLHAKEMLVPTDPNYFPREDMERLDTLLGGLAYDQI